MTELSENISNQFAFLRALVGFLGEKHQCNWWDTDFLSPTGLQFLTINFPRSAFAAGCNSVSEAAKRLHDQRIGKGGVFHLFRLPESVEERIHQAIMTMDFKALAPYFESKDSALDALAKSAPEPIKPKEGPIQIGKAREIMNQTAIERLAQLYFSAFANSIQCFPYFSST